MEASEAMIASLTVNVCILIVLIVSWILRRRVGRGEGGAGGGGEVEGLKVECEESDTHERTPAKHDILQRSTGVESMDAFVISDIVMSAFCFGAGIYIITSSSFWQCPFVCQVTPSGVLSDPSSNQAASRTPFGQVPSALLSAAFGRFIFSFFHLLYAACKSHWWNLWSVVRSGYLCINVIIVGVILATGEDLLGGSLVLLMEVDTAIEGVCQVIDRRIADKRERTARILLSVLGCAMSIGTRVVMTWVICLSLGHAYNPIAMNVLSLGIASFGFIFYQAYTLLAMKQHFERIQKVVRDGDRSTVDETELYAGKSRCLGPSGPGSKDVAFYLMTEGLIEISSYAKTVAGMITGKKLVPVKHLCDNFMPVKRESKSVKPKIAST